MAEHILYHISRISNEHSDWLRGMDFYAQELDILKKRLAEVSARYTKPEVKAEVEHFQNQFIIQRNNLDELRHEVRAHEVHMGEDAEKLAAHLSNHTLAEHDALRDRYAVLEKTIAELRYEFNRFLARYL